MKAFLYILAVSLVITSLNAQQGQGQLQWQTNGVDIYTPGTFRGGVKVESDINNPSAGNHIVNETNLTVTNLTDQMTNLSIYTDADAVQSSSTSTMVVGMESVAESNSFHTIGISGKADYSCAFGTLGDYFNCPKIVGTYGEANIQNATAVPFAFGTLSKSQSDHNGLNIGVMSFTESTTTYANIGILSSTNMSETGFADMLSNMAANNPNRFTASVMAINNDQGNEDYNLFICGQSKSFIESKLGVGVNPNTSAKLEVGGSVLFSGGQGAAPVAGAGNRMMWVADRSAFRAGKVTADQWDDANVGQYSFATGYNTIASDRASIAIGAAAASKGKNAIAIGQNVQALAPNSFVIGSGASGHPLKNKAKQSLVIGFNTDQPTLFVAPGTGTATHGKIGVNMLNPSFALDVNGDVRAHNIINVSDARYKKGIKTLESSMDAISQLRGVSYKFKDNSTRTLDNRAQIGFIAQELREVFPELVYEDENGYLGVDYVSLIPVLVEGMKEMDAENDAKDARIKDLEDEMGELKSLVQAALLQQADVNVTEHYLAASEKSINVYPNPTNAIANIEYYVSEETVTAISITSVDGSIVATDEQVNSKSGWNRIVFDGSQLASGIYHYTIQSNGETQNGQIIISK